VGDVEDPYITSLLFAVLAATFCCGAGCGWWVRGYFRRRRIAARLSWVRARLARDPSVQGRWATLVRAALSALNAREIASHLFASLSRFATLRQALGSGPSRARSRFVAGGL
jgi:hypothetical protein